MSNKEQLRLDEPQREVHPDAALFPMMTDDELVDLAADIKANGLIHPIIVDGEGKLIDGRNRLRACEIAGVEPRFESLNGHDPKAFIVSANLARRNLTKSQQAIALAMIYPDPDQRGRGKKSEAEKLRESRGFSRDLLEQARTILRHSADLAQDVLHARKHFDVALKEVRDAELRQKSHDARISELRSKAPDVAALVDDGRLSIEAGLAELAQRQQNIRRMIEDARISLSRFIGLAAHLTVIKSAIALKDSDLAMIGMDREEVDLLGILTDKEIASFAAAAGELKRMKANKKG